MAPKSRFWEPITDLSDDWPSLTDPSVPAMVSALQDQESELPQKGIYDAFLVRLRREFAVETGAIEQIYQINEGATRTLIERGLDAALISHEDTAGQEPELVVAKIKDQYAAIEGVYRFVSSQRQLTRSYVLQLYQVVTEHQGTFTGRDTLGQTVIRPLPKGFKTLPNNVEGPNGFSFEFCPPIQVESEMDRLLELHDSHDQNGVCPLVSAAWLHHRFALIHPFTDGNGRMARLLASAILLKARWLPLVVRREDKPHYIGGLRKADDGDLRPLVELFGKLQRNVVRQALSVGENTLREGVQIARILESARLAFEARTGRRVQLHERAKMVAASLQALAQERFEAVSRNVAEIVQAADEEFDCFVNKADNDDANAGYYRFQIVQCARKLGYYANLSGYRSWAALIIRTDVRVEILLSVHQLGHGASGIFVCTAMFFTKRAGGDGETEIGDITSLSEQPFEFAFAEEPGNVQRRFGEWFEKCISEGLKHWRNEIA